MPVELGLWLDFGGTSRSLNQQLPERLELLRLAEAQGFGSVWVGESYSFDVTSPLLLLAALAPQTSLALGTGVVLLPSWQPLRLAYEAASLDQLSGGRLIVGLGLGRANLQRRFGLDPGTVASYADETLAMLRQLWRGAAGFHGTYVNVEGGIRPLPLQPGGPPIWVGGAIRRSVERAAEYGDAFYASTTHSLDHLASQAHAYRAALSKRGKDPASAVIAANRLVLVAETQEEAWRAARVYFGPVFQKYAAMGSLGEELRAARLGPEQLFDRLGPDFGLIGTPDQIAAQIARYAEIGVTHIHARLVPLETPSEVAARTIRLLGEQVMPRLD